MKQQLHQAACGMTPEGTRVTIGSTDNNRWANPTQIRLGAFKAHEVNGATDVVTDRSLFVYGSGKHKVFVADA